MKRLTTVCFLVAAVLLSALPAAAATPRFNGDNISATLPTFNAIFYGAKCDGTTDDTTAINAAISAANTAGGGVVLLPMGTCRNTSGSITLKSNVYLRGMGQGATTLKPAANPTYPTINFAASTSSSGVSNLSINGNATVNGTRGADDIDIPNGTSNIEVYGVEAYASADNCIEADGTQIQVHNNYIHGCMTNGIYAIGVDATHRASYIKIHDDLVMNTSAGSANVWDGDDVDGCTSNIEVYNETVIGNDIITYEPATTCSSSFQNSFTNDTVIGSTENGFDVTGALTDITAKNIRVYSPTGDCVIDNTQGLTSSHLVFEGIYCINPTKDGFWVGNASNPPAGSGGPSDVDISDSYVEGVGSGYSAVSINNLTTAVRIRSNTLIPVSGAYAANTTNAGSSVYFTANYASAGASGIFNTLSTQSVGYTIPVPASSNSWLLTAVSGGNLTFSYNGTPKMGLDNSGDSIVYGNVTLQTTGNGLIQSNATGATVPFKFNAYNASAPTGDLAQFAIGGSTKFKITNGGAAVPLAINQSANCGNIACRATMTNGTYTWTFASAYTSIPSCTATEETPSSFYVHITTVSTTAVTVASSSTTGNSDTVDIHCIGSPN